VCHSFFFKALHFLVSGPPGVNLYHFPSLLSLFPLSWVSRPCCRQRIPAFRLCAIIAERSPPRCVASCALPEAFSPLTCTGGLTAQRAPHRERAILQICQLPRFVLGFPLTGRPISLPLVPSSDGRPLACCAPSTFDGQPAGPPARDHSVHARNGAERHLSLYLFPP